MEENLIERDLTPKLGDTVRVINKGSIYSTFESAARTMGLKLWKYGNSAVRTDVLYLIINDYLVDGRKRILGITDHKIDYIMDEAGVEIVDPSYIFSKVDSVRKSIKQSGILFDVNNLDLYEEINPGESETSNMTENLAEMVSSESTESAPAAEVEVAKVAEEANQILADKIQEEIISFATSLSGDVKTVTHKNTTSIKFKNRNFVYLTRNSKKQPPLKVQVKQGKEWPVIVLDAVAGFDALKQVIQTSFNEVQG